MMRDSTGHFERDAECLQMPVKAVKYTGGPEGPFHTLLVFRDIPHQARREPTERKIQRERILDEAMPKVGHVKAKKRF